jgi:molybdate transport system substrate-binding protein
MKKNLTKLLSLLSVFTLIFLALSCGTGSKKNVQNKSGDSEVQPPIMVFAAASLTDVLSEIIDSFEVKYQVKVQTNMASSGTLARQIEQGGTPDIFISASKKWADYIDSLGYILSGTKVAIAKNDLVLIAPLNSTLEVSVIDSSLNFVFLLGGERLSI